MASIDPFLIAPHSERSHRCNYPSFEIVRPVFGARLGKAIAGLFKRADRWLAIRSMSGGDPWDIATPNFVPTGRARAFKKGCSAAEYDVRGMYATRRGMVAVKPVTLIRPHENFVSRAKSNGTARNIEWHPFYGFGEPQSRFEGVVVLVANLCFRHWSGFKRDTNPQSLLLLPPQGR